MNNVETDGSTRHSYFSMEEALDPTEIARCQQLSSTARATVQAALPVTRLVDYLSEDVTTAQKDIDSLTTLVRSTEAAVSEGNRATTAIEVALEAELARLDDEVIVARQQLSQLRSEYLTRSEKLSA